MKVPTLVLLLGISGGAMVVAGCTEATTAPPPPDTSNVCSQDLCAANSDLAQECTNFLNSCLTYTADDDSCVGAAIAICNAI